MDLHQLYLRQATAADATAIASLSEQFGYHTTTSETEARIKELTASKNDCIIVAEKEGVVIGWIHGFIALRVESAPFAEIGGLVVEARYRGLGIGNKLIGEVVAWSTQKAIYHIRVRCNTKRNATHEFYRHLGFLETKEQKVFDLRVNPLEHI